MELEFLIPRAVSFLTYSDIRPVAIVIKDDEVWKEIAYDR